MRRLLISSQPELVCVCLQVNQTVSPQYSRNSLAQATEATSIFTIRDVNVRDTGTYTCTAQSMDDLVTRSTVVIVHGKNSHTVNLDTCKHRV